MLEAVDKWLHAGEGVGGSDAAAAFHALEERRQAQRYRLVGGEVFLFLEGDQRVRFRLRDLCSLGLSGLTDAPLRIGERVIVQLEEMLMPAGQVVWTRRVMAGIAFINPVPLARMKRLCERHEAGAAWSPAMRAGSDMHSWWTDLGAQQEGRQARLRSGGHKHPLPR